jgi:hypothetical protein
MASNLLTTAGHDTDTHVSAEGPEEGHPTGGLGAEAYEQNLRGEATP